MAKSTNINNRRYLGNKYKLLPFIKKVVDSECTDIEIVVDIFSGTGAVASAFQDKQLITNDILYSNYISNFAWFSPRKYSRKKIETIIDEYNANDKDKFTDNVVIMPVNTDELSSLIDKSSEYDEIISKVHKLFEVDKINFDIEWREKFMGAII